MSSEGNEVTLVDPDAPKTALLVNGEKIASDIPRGKAREMKENLEEALHGDE